MLEPTEMQRRHKSLNCSFEDQNYLICKENIMIINFWDTCINDFYYDF